MSNFEDYCIRGRAKHGDKFIPPTGLELIDAYNKAPALRVKVRTTYPSGESFERWGYVALTTGWKPSFMLMRRRGQIGSSDLLDERDDIISTRYLWSKS